MSANVSRTKRFFYSTVTTALYQLVLLAAGFVVPKVMLTFYSSEINGLVTSITQFITYFNLVEAGLSGAMVYALYKPLAAGDAKEISAVVVAAKKFYFQAGRLFLVLVAAMALCYPVFVKTESLSFAEVGVLVFVLGMNSVLEFFALAKYRALLTADQKTYIISLASIVQVVLNTVIICVLAGFGVGVVFLRTIALLSVFARTAILMYYVKKKYPQIDYRVSPKENALDKRWDAVYMQVLGAIHTGAPVVILTFVVGDLRLVSVFSVYNMIITGLHGVMSIFSSGLASSFGNVIVRKEYDILQKTYQQFELAYLSVMTLAYSVALVMIMPFIKIYTAGVSDADYYVPLVGALIVINAFFFNLKSPQAMMLIAAGLYRESRVQTTVQGVLVVVLGCIFGRLWGIEGILVACIVSNLYRDVDLLFFIPKYVTKLPVSNTLKRWLRAGCCFVLAVQLSALLPISAEGYFAWALWATASAAISAAVLLVNALLFDRNVFFALLRRMKGLLYRA